MVKISTKFLLRSPRFFDAKTKRIPKISADGKAFEEKNVTYVTKLEKIPKSKKFGDKQLNTDF